MHRLLRRQLRIYLGVADEVPAALKTFVAAVDAAYGDFDSDRAMLERSLELSSKELSDAETAGEFIGIGVFGDGALGPVREGLDAVLEAGTLTAYFEAALNHAGGSCNRRCFHSDTP